MDDEKQLHRVSIADFQQKLDATRNDLDATRKKLARFEDNLASTARVKRLTLKVNKFGEQEKRPRESINEEEQQPQRMRADILTRLKTISAALQKRDASRAEHVVSYLNLQILHRTFKFKFRY